MRQKVVKQLNKLAKLLELTRGERKKLKRDYRKTYPRSVTDLKERVARVARTHEAVDEISS